MSFERVKRILRETRKFQVKKLKESHDYYTVSSPKLKNVTQAEAQFLHEEIQTQMIDLIETVQEITQTLKSVATDVQTIKDSLKERN